MPPLEIDNPFWRFSLRVYAAPGVAAECLDLQDRLGLDVNVVLFAAWLGAERGLQVGQADLDRIEQAVGGWSDGVVKPLRAVRQRLKQMSEIADPQVQALRKRVAGTELFSEQVEQALLYRLADDIGRPLSGPGKAASRANIAAILATRGADEAAFPLPKLLAAV
jgi:uncharacterized protein (TIGR02444 family)